MEVILVQPVTYLAHRLLKNVGRRRVAVSFLARDDVTIPDVKVWRGDLERCLPGNAIRAHPADAIVHVTYTVLPRRRRHVRISSTRDGREVRAQLRFVTIDRRRAVG